MADRWAVATGNWSSTATWNGGTLPTSADDVFADGFTVTINQDITVLSIRTTQRSGGTAGGGFTASGTRTINADIIAGTTDCLAVSTAGSNITVNGNVTGGTAPGADGILFSAGTTTLVITGNVTGGSASNAMGLLASATSTSNYTVNGNCTGGSNGTARGVSHSGTSDGIINGDTIASSGNGCLLGNAGAELTLNGNPTNLQSLAISSGFCVINLTSDITGTGGNGNINMTGGSCICSGGNAIGGAASDMPAVRVAGGSLKFTGNAIASSSSYAVLVMIAGSAYIIGNAVANSTRSAITYSGTGQLVVIGNVTGGTTGDGIDSLSASVMPIVVHGTVTGGSSAGGHGISHAGSSDIRIFGSEVAGAGGAAVNNTGTGTLTTVSVGGGGGGPSVPLIGPGLVY